MLGNLAKNKNKKTYLSSTSELGEYKNMKNL